MPIGSIWAAGSWADGAWAAGSWADEGGGVPVIPNPTFAAGTFKASQSLHVGGAEIVNSARAIANVTAVTLEPGAAIRLYGAAGPLLVTGSGSPEGVVSAPIGSLYTRIDGGAGSTMYVKESGAAATGWRAV